MNKLKISLILFALLIICKNLSAQEITETANAHNATNPAVEIPIPAKLILQFEAGLNIAHYDLTDVLKPLNITGASANISNIVNFAFQLSVTGNYFFLQWLGIRSKLTFEMSRANGKLFAAAPTIKTEIEGTFNAYHLNIEVAPIFRFLGICIYFGINLNLPLKTTFSFNNTTSVENMGVWIPVTTENEMDVKTKSTNIVFSSGISYINLNKGDKQFSFDVNFKISKINLVTGGKINYWILKASVSFLLGL
jgi:hypothetical protein